MISSCGHCLEMTSSTEKSLEAVGIEPRTTWSYARSTNPLTTNTHKDINISKLEIVTKTNWSGRPCITRIKIVTNESSNE